ncbi:MAG: TonB C-terminal domain-containing protein [Deltaproteobacteria bacterium]|nr:TonB C-terminal domain-containing protein [Deltaproteobacteria bacterium]
MTDQKAEDTERIRLAQKVETTDVMRARGEAPQTTTTTTPAGTIPPSRMASMAGRRSSQQRSLSITIGVSLFIHLFAFAAWALFPTGQESKPINLDEAVVKARLVKLGKPRDPTLLPRLPTAPPPAPADKKAPPVIAPPDAPDKEKIEPDKKSASDILDKFKTDNQKPRDLNDLIRDSVGDDDEGQEFGDKEGTALDGEVTDSYFARVTARIIKAMEVSSVLGDDERVRLKAVLCLKIDDAGAVSDIKVKSSGSTVFDSDVTAAAARSSPVPAPPPPARARAAEGVCFNVCPVSCN